MAASSHTITADVLTAKWNKLSGVLATVGNGGMILERFEETFLPAFDLIKEIGDDTKDTFVGSLMGVMSKEMDEIQGLIDQFGTLRNGKLGLRGLNQTPANINSIAESVRSTIANRIRLAKSAEQPTEQPTEQSTTDEQKA